MGSTTWMDGGGAMYARVAFFEDHDPAQIDELIRRLDERSRRHAELTAGVEGLPHAGGSGNGQEHWNHVLRDARWLGGVGIGAGELSEDVSRLAERQAGRAGRLRGRRRRPPWRDRSVVTGSPAMSRD